MKNPQIQIVNLRDKLTNRLVDLDAKLRDLQSFYSMLNDKDYLDTINICPQFFRMHSDSLLKDIIISLAKTFDPKSKRSIHTFLKWLNDNKNNLKYKGEPLNSSDISDFHTHIMDINDILKKIKTQRDKFLAHDDSKYFDQEFKIHEEAPIDLSELEAVITTIRKILFRIYGALENVHYDIKISNLKKSDYVIKLLKHHRILYQNKTVTEMMFRGEIPYP